MKEDEGISDGCVYLILIIGALSALGYISEWIFLLF
jgi:hypothetical protein